MLMSWVFRRLDVLRCVSLRTKGHVLFICATACLCDANVIQPVDLRGGVRQPDRIAEQHRRDGKVFISYLRGSPVCPHCIAFLSARYAIVARSPLDSNSGCFEEMASVLAGCSGDPVLIQSLPIVASLRAADFQAERLRVRTPYKYLANLTLADAGSTAPAKLTYWRSMLKAEMFGTGRLSCVFCQAGQLDDACCF